jgi:hypothetical protein
MNKILFFLIFIIFLSSCTKQEIGFSEWNLVRLDSIHLDNKYTESLEPTLTTIDNGKELINVKGNIFLLNKEWNKEVLTTRATWKFYCDWWSYNKSLYKYDILIPKWSFAIVKRFEKKCKNRQEYISYYWINLDWDSSELSLLKWLKIKNKWKMVIENWILKIFDSNQKQYEENNDLYYVNRSEEPIYTFNIKKYLNK